MRKAYTANIPSNDFKVTTPENPLLSKQAVTSKGIPVLYINVINSVSDPVSVCLGEQNISVPAYFGVPFQVVSRFLKKYICI